MTDRVWFTRPIEIQDLATHFRIKYDVLADAIYTANIDPGTYSSLPALLLALQTAANDTAISVNITWELVESTYTWEGNTFSCLKARCSSDAAHIKVVFEASSILGEILGDPNDSMNTSYAATLTAPYSPSHQWTSTWQNATQDYFAKDLNQVFAGHKMKSGRLAGNRTGPDINDKTLSFINEPAINIFDEAATTVSDSYNVYANQNIYKLTDCMFVNNQESGNADSRGFFYYPDWNDAIDNPASVPGGSSGTSTRYEGINYNTDATYPSRFTFCQFDPNPFGHPAPSAETGRLFYEFTLKIHTVDGMPTWQAPDQSG